MSVYIKGMEMPKSCFYCPMRHGKWILLQDADDTGNATYECSVCHHGEVHVPIVEVHYCWNCGAKMEGT